MVDVFWEQELLGGIDVPIEVDVVVW